MLALRFVLDDGTCIDMQPHNARRFNIAPLRHADLVAVLEDPDASFPAVINNVETKVPLPGFGVTGPLTLKASMQLTQDQPVFGLIDGGWVPMPWA